MNKEPNSTDMVFELLRKRERFANQTRNSLTQGVVEALNVARLPCVLANSLMTLGGDD